MLTVEITVMPAASSSSMSCQRFSLRHPGHVGVGELVDERDLRRSGEDGVDVHLLEHRASVGHRACEARPRGRRSASAVSGAAVGLDEADDHVGATIATAPALVEHGEGLADARGGTDVDAQLASGHDRLLRRRVADDLGPRDSTLAPSDSPTLADDLEPTRARARPPHERADEDPDHALRPRRPTLPSRAVRRVHDRLARLVEREVQLEHVDARLAEEPEAAAVGVLVDETQHLVDVHAPGFGDTRSLQAGVGDRDVRVEPGCPTR